MDQLADFQRRMVLLEGAILKVEVRHAPTAPTLTPATQGLAHPGGCFGSNRPSELSIKRDTRPLWQAKRDSKGVKMRIETFLILYW